MVLLIVGANALRGSIEWGARVRQPPILLNSAELRSLNLVHGLEVETQMKAVGLVIVGNAGEGGMFRLDPPFGFPDFLSVRAFVGAWLGCDEIVHFGLRLCDDGKDCEKAVFLVVHKSATFSETLRQSLALLRHGVQRGRSPHEFAPTKPL